MIARAIAQKPQLLILDEAFTGIEERSKMQILDRLFAHEVPWTIIDISQDADTIFHASRMVFLKEGKVVESGTFKRASGEERQPAGTPFSKTCGTNSQMNSQMNTVEPSEKLQKGPRFRSLQMVRTPVLLTVIITFVILIMVAATVSALFLPWRQSVTGTGRIIVFSPMDRPQTIEAQIPGRIVNWFVRDGQDVEKGEKIVGLAELDSRFLDTRQLKTLLSQKTALEAKT